MTDTLNDSNSVPATPLITEPWFLETLSQGFEGGATTLKTALDQAQKKLNGDPSSPSLLADYQAKMSEYTLFRNAQSTTVKAYKDIAAAIIQNFR
jgi:type III secretion protein F